MPASRIIELRNQGELRLYEGSNGAEKITLKAPASLAADLTFQLPDTAGSASQFLQTNGAGVLTWAAGASTLQQAYDASSPPTITIGGGGHIVISRAAGGECLRLTSSGGDPHLSLFSGSAELRISSGTGSCKIGVMTPEDLDFLTNGTVRMTIIDPSGNVGIGTLAPADRLHVSGGGILLENNQFYRGKILAGTAHSILGITSGDVLKLGGATTSLQLHTNSLEALRIDSSQQVFIGDPSGAAASRLHVRQTTTDSAGVFWKTGGGANHCVFIDNDGTGAGLAIQQDGVGTALLVTNNTTGDCIRIDGVNTGPEIRAVTTLTAAHIFQVWQGPNAAAREFRHRETTHTFTAGATNTIVGFFLNAIKVRGISYRVTTAIGGATGFDMGVSGATTRYGSNVSTGAGTTTTSDSSGAGTEEKIYPAGADLLFTAVGGSFTGTGVIRLCLIYETMNAPTS